MKRLCFAPLVALSLALSCPSVAVANEKPATDRQDAASLLDQARVHMKHKRFKAALPLLQEAYAKDPTSHRIVGNLGIVEHELGRWADASNHLTEARALFPDEAPQAHREAIEMRLEDAARQAGLLTAVLSPSKACLRVTGLPPKCGEQVSIYVAPGATSFTIEAPGHVVQRRTLELEAGTETALTVRLAPTPIEPPPPAAEQPDGIPIWPSYLAASLGLAGMTTGLVMFVVGDASAREADRELIRLREDVGQPAPCATPTSETGSRCSSIADHLTRHDQLHDAAAGVLVGSAVAIVASTVLFGFSVAHDDEADAGSLELVPSLSPRSAALTLRGHF